MDKSGGCDVFLLATGSNSEDKSFICPTIGLKMSAYIFFYVFYFLILEDKCGDKRRGNSFLSTFLSFSNLLFFLYFFIIVDKRTNK